MSAVRDAAGAKGGWAWDWARFWSLALAVAVLSFTAWLYRIPPDYVCRWGVNAAAATHFARTFRLPLPSAVDAASFQAGFELTLGGAWLAYLGLVATGLGGAAPSRRFVLWLAVATSLALAVLGPPALSPDIYAYVGYARLMVVQHQSPYEATQMALVRFGDPTGPYLRWPISSPYGPLWTLTSSAVVLALPRASIMAPLVVLKLIGAGAVLAMAEGSRRLAEKLSPGRGAAVFAAVAFNPLFLIEGVVNGHNDVVTMAFVLWAFVSAADGRFLRAFTLVGAAAAIKFFPLMLAPWFLWLALRSSPPDRRGRLAFGALFCALSPLIITFAPFWRGMSTLAGLRMRSVYGERMAGSGGHGVIALASLYALLSLWVLRGGLERVVCAWVIGSFLVMYLVSGIGFPWYLIWPMGVALVLVEGRSLVFPAILYGASLALMIQYVR